MYTTKDQVIENLRTNPRELISTIIYNNPNAVNQKLGDVTENRGETPEQLVEFVLALLDEGHGEAVNEIVQVPFNYESATPLLIEVHDQMVNDLRQTPQGGLTDSSTGLFVLATSKMPVINNSNGPCKCKSLPCFMNKPVYKKIKRKHVIGLILLLLIVYIGFRYRTKVNVTVKQK